MIVVIVCPKCKGRDVVEERLSPLPVQEVSMDDLGKPLVWAEPAVLRQSHWRATCKDCGYSVEYYA